MDDMIILGPKSTHRIADGDGLQGQITAFAKSASTYHQPGWLAFFIAEPSS